jgi:hypothetical protein
LDGQGFLIYLTLQVGQGFLSDAQNMGMYEGEMQDGQPHGLGTIGMLTFKTKNYFFLAM